MKFCLLMPAYNAEKDIKKAIESVLSQSYSDFKLIVVNDGSKDNTGTILDGFSGDSRIKIITQENTGIAGAYKTAFEHIEGDYIMFLDSDDALAVDALADISETIKTKEPDILQFGISYFDEEWNHFRDLCFEEKNIFGNENIMLNYFNGINKGIDRPNLGIRAYKKDLLIDFIFPQMRSLGIDEIMNLYAMTKCQKVAFVPKAYYLCQSRSESVSRIKPSKAKVEGVLLSYKEMEKILLPSHSDMADLLYVKFIKFYISHLNSIKTLPEYKAVKKDFEQYVAVAKKSSRVNFDTKLKLRIFVLSHFPFLSTILSKN